MSNNTKRAFNALIYSLDVQIEDLEEVNEQYFEYWLTSIEVLRELLGSDEEILKQIKLKCMGIYKGSFIEKLETYLDETGDDIDNDSYEVTNKMKGIGG